MTEVADPLYPTSRGHGSAHRPLRWYVDDITGLMHPETEVTRDQDEQLRFIHDVDDLGRDDILEVWEFRSEEPLPEP